MAQVILSLLITRYLLIVVELCHNIRTRIQGYKYKDPRIQGCNITYFDAELCPTYVSSYFGTVMLPVFDFYSLG